MPPNAEDRPEDSFAGWVGRWVDLCQRHAAAVLIAMVLISALASAYLVQNLRIDTDTEDMLSADLAFRQNAIALDRAFPVLDDNLLIVLEAPNADAADFALKRMTSAMRASPDVFGDIFAPEADPFLQKHGFLYMETGALEDMATRLARAQPFLGTLWQQPNLIGLADMLDLLGDTGSASDPMLSEAGHVLTTIADVAARARQGDRRGLVWSELILGAEPVSGPVSRLIQTRPQLDYGSLHPAEHASETVYAIADRERLTGDGFDVRLSGSAALESDELKSVEVGMGLAGLISLSIVILVLAFGLRSPAIIVALFVTLLVGLLWTAAFAILALGSLNLISVAFAVLFVGLSVDFGIHYALRATEYAHTEESWAGALIAGGRSVGGSLAICTLTTAIAFFSFLPTSYVGLAELGLIAGVGMFIALICNLTVLPALLRVLIRKPPARRLDGAAPHHVPKFRRSARAVVIVGIASALVSAWLATGTRFDFDPMNLKDPDAPSVVTLFDLMEDGTVHPYAADILAPDMQTAQTLIDKLDALPGVDGVGSILSLIPEDQDAKLATIDRMALFLGTAFFAPQGSVSLDDGERETALARVRQSLDALSAHPVLGAQAARLTAAFEGAGTEDAARINDALFRYLPMRLDDLAAALNAGPVDLDSIPEELKRRYVSADGQVRLDVQPAADMRDPAALRAFVTSVQAVAPHATGAPVVIVEAGKAVLEAFGLALSIAIAAIAVVLWSVLRNLRDVLLVFAPVCVAALWTLAVSSLAGVPFNFANVIVLPLLFGLSVDFGIHLVLRQRAATGGGDGHDAMTTTTPRAILLSALTTVGSFGSIMLSGHPGTASMGLLLTIAISLSLIAILVFLPALMHLVDRRAADAGREPGR